MFSTLPKSLTATISISGLSHATFKKALPILPKPLIPTLIFLIFILYQRITYKYLCDGQILGNKQHFSSHQKKLCNPLFSFDILHIQNSSIFLQSLTDYHSRN